MQTIARRSVATSLIIILSIVAISEEGHAQQGRRSPVQDAGIQATIDISYQGNPVNPFTYGMFTELLGNMFEFGVWAEMLSDRKFFYPVDTTSRLNPVNTRGRQNRWRPVGTADAVKMERENAFVGEQTPVIQLTGSTSLGMKQSGLTFRSGREYTGYLVFAAEQGVEVEVSLVWGTGASEKQSTRLSGTGSDYKKIPFRFTAGATTENGTLEIIGKGRGSLRIGAVSLMPADNLFGFRKDLIELLKGLNSGIYRWPGGNMLAGYDWRDGIGDRDKRAPRYDWAWNAVESNDVGTDEFLILCKLLEIDPFLVVNIGLGDAFSAAQWVEYVNGSVNTPMGALRAKNGYPEPYGVVWWGVGNEMYGQWQLGHMSIGHYVLKHNYFASAMKNVDPTIKLIASGATPFETSTTARHHRMPLPSRLPYLFGSPEDWTGRLLAGARANIDFVSEHLYPVTNQAFNADSQRFVPSNDPLADRVRRVPNRIKAVAVSWDEYVKSMPELSESGITFWLDEWTGGGRGMERTLGAATGLNEIIRHSDIITMGGYTSFTGCLAFNGNDATYSSTGLVFKLYTERLGTIPVAVTGNSPQHAVKGTIGVDRPAESSGSATWPLDVIAALSGDKKRVTVSVVNPTEEAHEITLLFRGVSRPGNSTKLYQIAPPSLLSANRPGTDAEVTIKVTTMRRMPEKVIAPPFSISLYEFEIAK